MREWAVVHSRGGVVCVYATKKGALLAGARELLKYKGKDIKLEDLEEELRKHGYFLRRATVVVQ